MGEIAAPRDVADRPEGTPFLAGEKVELWPLTQQAYVTLNARWTNDPEVCALLNRGTFPTTPELHLSDFKARSGGPPDIEFFLCDRSTAKIVGITGLHSIQWIPRHIEFRILIGEKLAWNRGLGSEALVLLCRYAFDRLNMNKVWLGVNTSNERAVASYEKCGFVNEGVLRQEAYAQGRYHDVLRMSLLRSEFVGAGSAT